MKPATAANRYRSLKVFCPWLEEEGEIAADPMAKLKPPAIPEQPILGELDAVGLARGSEEGNGRARYRSPATPDDGAGRERACPDRRR